MMANLKIIVETTMSLLGLDWDRTQKNALTRFSRAKGGRPYKYGARLMAGWVYGMDSSDGAVLVLQDDAGETGTGSPEEFEEAILMSEWSWGLCDVCCRALNGGRP